LWEEEAASAQNLAYHTWSRIPVLHALQ